MPGDRGYNAAIDTLDQALLQLVRTRRAATQDPPEDLLSRLLAVQDADSGERMSDKQIRDEIVTLFVAGQDTTSATLSWLFYLLDRHPEIFERLRAEINEVLGDRRPTVEDLSRLSYTQRVLQEVMRLYPAGWVSPRFSNQEATLGSYAIPANKLILLSPYVTHRDPSHWGERPDDLDPDHFLPERVAKRHRYAYFPFSGGSRQCIGNHFFMMEAQLILTQIVRRIHPRLPSRKVVQYDALGNLRPRNGLLMKLERAS